MKRVLVLISIAALGALGCEKEEKKEDKAAWTPPSAPAPSTTSGQPAGASPHGAAPAPGHGGAGSAPQPAAGAGTGKVLETMNSGGYTYVKVDVSGKEVWAAGPQTMVEVGDQVRFSGGAPMKDYHSKTLNRTFDTVYFVQKIAVGKVAGAPAGAAQPSGGVGGATQSTGAPTMDKVDVGKIEKAKGGKTVAEVFGQKAELAGKMVTVRGRVVKFTGPVMGRNWLHLQDGTGTAGSNDLTVTTADTSVAGSIVTIRGTVVVNKDFGAGYKYAVLIEGAKVTAE